MKRGLAALIVCASAGARYVASALAVVKGGWQRAAGLEQRRLFISGLAVIVATLAIAGLLVRGIAGPGSGGARGSAPLPDFARIHNVVARKQAFFDYLLPIVAEANADVLRDRSRLLRMREKLIARQAQAARRAAKTGHAPVPVHARGREAHWVRRLAQEYALLEKEALSSARAANRRPSSNGGASAAAPASVVDLALIDQLLQRVDALPASLVLAQAAVESAWGTSRFARQGNNLFGMRSYDGTGLIPRQRSAGATFRVARYASPRDSVRAYIKNINTQRAYRSLRSLRAEDRRRGRVPTGLRLANGLGAYSERGGAYIQQVQSLIQSNRLERYDSLL